MQARSRSVLLLSTLTFLLLAFLAADAGAQSMPSAQFSSAAGGSGSSWTIGYGLKSGGLWPSFDAAKNDLGGNIGPMIGAFVDVNPFGRIGVTSEALYVSKPESNIVGAPTGALRCLELPVMLRLRQPLTPNHLLAVYGIIGPVFDLKLSGSDAYDNLSTDLVVGGGLEIKHVMLEGRINRGSREFGGTSLTQQTFSMLLGFRIKP